MHPTSSFGAHGTMVAKPSLYRRVRWAARRRTALLLAAVLKWLIEDELWDPDHLDAFPGFCLIDTPGVGAVPSSLTGRADGLPEPLGGFLDREAAESSLNRSRKETAPAGWTEQPRGGADGASRAALESAHSAGQFGEPWGLRRVEHLDETIIFDCDGVQVARVHSASPRERHEIASRIVDCVNECAYEHLGGAA